MLWKNVLLGVVIGLIYSIVFFTSTVFGRKPRPNFPPLRGGSLYIPVGTKYLHLHHWILAFLVLLILVPIVALCDGPPFAAALLGFFSVLMVQGLSYDDAFFIVKTRKEIR